MAARRRVLTSSGRFLATGALLLAVAACGTAGATTSDQTSGPTANPSSQPASAVPPAVTAAPAGPTRPTAAGTVKAWGDDSSKQTDVPAGLTGVVAVAAGDAFSLALKSD